MHITGLELVTLRVNHRGDWLHVRLTTDEEVSGIGEASHGGFGPERDAIVAAILTGQCRPLLLGKDPRAVQAALAPLQPLVDGLASATAVSACEQALWDLAGKAAGLPVYRLLGGPVRDRIPLYANINRAVVSRAPEEFAREAAAAVAAGFRAVKCAPFDGMERRRVRDRDQRGRIARGIACVAAVRSAVGPEIDVYVDCHSHFDVPTAVEVAHALHDLGIWWFEEPVPTEDLAALREVRPHVSALGMELIGGELLYGVGRFLALSRGGCVGLRDAGCQALRRHRRARRHRSGSDGARGGSRATQPQWPGFAGGLGTGRGGITSSARGGICVGRSIVARGRRHARRAD